MNHHINDYTDILLRFDRIGIREYANANEECPLTFLRKVKHLSPQDWKDLDRVQREKRASALGRIRKFEIAYGITL